MITRLVLSDYRGFAACDVRFGPLTFLVGPNGAGKSNLLDALRFTADSLRGPMADALRDRWGIHEVARKSSGRPAGFGLRIEFELARCRGHLAFAVAAKTGGGYEVEREECAVVTADGAEHDYRVEDGSARSTMLLPPAVAADRLYLVRAAGDAIFRPVHEALSQMGFYDLDPEAMRRSRLPAPERLLRRDGSNIAGVLFRLEERSPEVKRGIEEYLGSVVDGIVGVDPKRFGRREGLEFRKTTGDAQPPRRFHSAGMSDGALRALGVFTALFQSAGEPGSPRFVGIEEPETTLHPSAAGVLLDALRESAAGGQVLVTTHSTDLLDDKHIAADELRAVEMQRGRSVVGPIDEPGRAALRDRLCTPGELLRSGQVRPDPEAAGRSFDREELFDPTPLSREIAPPRPTRGRAGGLTGR